MFDPRASTALLMGVSIALSLATTPLALPSIVFLPALLLFAIGAFKFLRSNTMAMAKADKRIENRLNPTLRQNRHAQAHAERLASKRGQALNSLSGAADEGPERAARMASGSLSARAIELDTSESDFVVGADVFFPVEVQTGDALADPLQKLNRLMSQGVLTEEEYAIAKAKLLD